MADGTTTARVALQCMEIWGGNHGVETAIGAPGIEAWLHSRVYQGHASGGDIHYVSNCAAGIITRFALADVSGHGDAASAMALQLRALMRRSINTPDQTRLARALNRSFGAISGEGRFATALLATYFAPTEHLVVCNAGHPRPFWYRADRGEWCALDDRGADRSGPPRNLPLGVISPTSYTQFAVRLAPGDFVVAYSDALTEAADASGRQLGEAGLMELARRAPRAGVQDLADAILGGVTRHAGRADAGDDTTLLVLRRTGARPPRRTLRARARVTAKMLGITR